MTTQLSVLNQAMLTQVLHELREGNLQRCKSLGLAEEDLYVLLALPPATLSRLANTPVPWVEVRIDTQVFRRIIDQAQQDEERESMIRRALQLGASGAIMRDCFGMLHSETAIRRRMLKVDARKGRPSQPSEEQEHAIWRRWVQLNKTLDDAADPAERLDAMMLIAEEQRVDLVSVWRQIVQLRAAHE